MLGAMLSCLSLTIIPRVGYHPQFTNDDPALRKAEWDDLAKATELRSSAAIIQTQVCQLLVLSMIHSLDMTTRQVTGAQVTPASTDSLGWTDSLVVKKD